jgi:hypothetical protein
MNAEGFSSGINPEYASQYPDWYKTKNADVAERQAFTAGWEAFFWTIQRAIEFLTA